MYCYSTTTDRTIDPMPLGGLLPSSRSRARAHVRDEGGQAVIIVGLSLVVLLAALALGAE